MAEEAPESCGADIHASTVVVGECGVVIRGAPGAGKTALALALVERFRSPAAFARLVADDRTSIVRRGGRLVARPHPALAGRVERRGLGIISVNHEPSCVVGLVVDLVDGPVDRMPEPDALRCDMAGVVVPRVAIPAAMPTFDALALVASALSNAASRA